MITKMDIVTTKDGKEITTSLKVAEVFGKEHYNVLRDIDSVDCSEEFNRLNFELINYTDSQGRKQKAYNITKDGFTFLAMGYRGEKAAKFKEDYIKEFNRRGEELKRAQLERERLKDIELGHFWNKQDIKDLYK